MALKGGIMPGFPDGRSMDGRAYRAFCVPFIEAFGGTVPAEARVLLRLAGRLSVHIEHVNAELERARARHRRRDVNRARRQLAGMTGDLLRMTSELRAMAAARPGEWGPHA